ncbi:MAG: response regulator transcription factor [Elusimicrobiota bacterium]
MRKSKYGGNKDGLGFYELMVVPKKIYGRAINAVKRNKVEKFYDILGVVPSTRPIHHEESNKILIIEDKLYLANAVEKALKSRGYSVAYTQNEQEGLEKVKKTEINLILLDLTLPDVDVIKICRILRSNVHTSHIPIIIINGNTNEEDIIEGLEAGADDYIGKDFSLLELAARVKAVLRSYH